MQNEQKLPQPRMTDRYADVAPCGRSGAMSAAQRRSRVSVTLMTDWHAAHAAKRAAPPMSRSACAGHALGKRRSGQT